MKIFNKYKYFILFCLILFAQPLLADNEMGKKLAGRIVLQVERNGEAWYINPINYERYSLGRPSEAFDLMQWLGIGISNQDLAKIPVGIMEYFDTDNDGDGLANRLEHAIGTNPESDDSDNDGFTDKTELNAGYNPLGEGSLSFDYNFIDENIGKIFLQVESVGEAWYLDPVSKKRYYLGRPADAFSVMRQLGLGIGNMDLGEIIPNLDDPEEEEEEDPVSPPPPPCEDCPASSPRTALDRAAEAVRSKNDSLAVKYFDPIMEKSVTYSLGSFNDEQRLAFANTLSGAKKVSQSDTEARYETPLYFALGGFMSAQIILLEKLDDVGWVITSM